MSLSKKVRSKNASESRNTSIYFGDAEERRIIREAADLEGESVSMFIRKVTVKAATKVVAQCPTCGTKLRKGRVRAAA